MAVNSTTSSSSVFSGYSSKLRLGGLATGLDTDSIISSLMKNERIPLDKILQKKQLAEWKRDAYRDVTSLLRGLKSDFLDMVKPANNMLSANTYKKFACSSSDSGIVTVTANSVASAGSHSVSVYNLATADKAVSSSGVTDALQGTAVSSYDLSGKSFRITLDGVTKEISLDNYSYTAGAPATSDIVSKAGTGIQALVDTAFGAGKITASYDGNTGKISFVSTGGASKITVSSGSNSATNALGLIGFTSGQSNRLDVTQSLDVLSTKFANDLNFNAVGKLSFTINSKTFEFDKSVSLTSMMNTINSDATANVNMIYDEASDKFILTSKQYGDGDNIRIDASSQQGNFFGPSSAAGIDILDGSALITAENQGVDAKVKIDDQLLVRSSNSFTINGVTYNLLKAHTSPDTQSASVSVSQDVDAVYNNIKAFIDKYNDVIEKINTKISEKYDRDYQPLTDDQRSSMSEEDIKKWEEKAKTGLLQNDSLLQNAVYSMRRALSDAVNDVGISLSSIGITTGTYSEKGKLTIDEAKLRDAISKNPDAISDLFCKSSTSFPSNNKLSASQKSTRYKEEGLAYRISDILDENIRTSGGKGALLLKAGITGDITEFDNTIYDEIEGYNDKISEWADKLKDKENYYYTKYTALEQAISKMNQQSSWLSSQLGSGS